MWFLGMDVGTGGTRAVVVDDAGKLIFTHIPPRSVYPIKVTVVAWQWGRSTPPLVQTAPLVGQTFMIMNH